jgi:hypothetical protein
LKSHQLMRRGFPCTSGVLFVCAARNVAEGTPESLSPSAEGGPDCRSCLNLVVGRLTVPNIESRCNQLKLGHPHIRPISMPVTYGELTGNIIKM